MKAEALLTVKLKEFRNLIQGLPPCSSDSTVIAFSIIYASCIIAESIRNSLDEQS